MVNLSAFRPTNLRLNNVQKAYVAGIIDGEGYVGLLKAKKDKHMRPVISVENASEPLIDYLLKTTRIGAKYRKIRKDPNPKHSQIWGWIVRKFSEIRSICEAVSPYLLIKKQNARLLLKLISLREESCKKRMKQFKRDESGKFLEVPSLDYSQPEIEIYEELRTLNNHPKVTTNV